MCVLLCVCVCAFHVCITYVSISLCEFLMSSHVISCGGKFPECSVAGGGVQLPERKGESHIFSCLHIYVFVFDTGIT